MDPPDGSPIEDTDTVFNGGGRSGRGRRLKVLVSAYACEPGQGSEPGVGWRLALELARHHDIWVLTRANNRSAIESALAAHDGPAPRFLYHDLPRWAGWWKSGGRGVQAYYYLWQLGSRAVAARAHRHERFDVVHHLTFGRYWSPSGVAGLGIPFVWGPLGGGETTPGPFRKALGFGGRRYEALRDVARSVGEHDPLVARTAARATIAIASTRDTHTRLRRLGCRDTRLLLQMGVDPNGSAALQSTANGMSAGNGSPEQWRQQSDDGRDRREGVAFFTLGRLIHWKGVHLAVAAFARANLPGSTLTIIGDGPQLSELRAQAIQEDVADRVRFPGALARDEALRWVRDHDVMVHPSLHDQAPAAVFEALALGKPVICLDIGGPAQQVSEDVGFAVPVLDPDQVVGDIAAAMRRLGTDPETLARMSSRAPAYVVERFSWRAKAGRISEYYREALERRSPTPSQLAIEGSAP